MRSRRRTLRIDISMHSLQGPRRITDGILWLELPSLALIKLLLLNFVHTLRVVLSSFQGSTGPPKIIPLSHYNLVNAANFYSKMTGWSPEVSVLHTPTAYTWRNWLTITHLSYPSHPLGSRLCFQNHVLVFWNVFGFVGKRDTVTAGFFPFSKPSTCCSLAIFLKRKFGFPTFSWAIASRLK